MLNPETKTIKLRRVINQAVKSLKIGNITKKHLLICSVFCLALMTVIGTAVFASYPKNETDGLLSPKGSLEIPTNEAQLPPPTPEPVIDDSVDRFGLMLLGYGGAGHQGGYLTDIIQVVEIDFDTQTLMFISLPRDLWVDVNGGRKINEVMALGLSPGEYPREGVVRDKVIAGVENLKKSVSEVTGVSVANFVGIDFGGFERLVNTLGGIEVNLGESFSDDWYPVRGRELELCGWTGEEVTAMSATMSGFLLEKQFPCRYEKLYYPAGKHKINGEAALKIARSRHGSSDFGRSNRQMAMLLGIRDKLQSGNSLDALPKTYENLNKMLVTDVKLAQLEVLVKLYLQKEEMKVVRVNLSTDNVLKSSTSSRGQYIVVPKNGISDWNSVIAYIEAEKKKAL